MRDAFTGIGSAVDHDPIAAGEVQLLRQVARNQKQFADQCSVIISRVRKAGNNFFRHDQDMYWRLGINVVKRNRVVIFPNDFCRDLPRNDFFENCHEP